MMSRLLAIQCPKHSNRHENLISCEEILFGIDLLLQLIHSLRRFWSRNDRLGVEGRLFVLKVRWSAAIFGNEFPLTIRPSREEHTFTVERLWDVVFSPISSVEWGWRRGFAALAELLRCFRSRGSVGLIRIMASGDIVLSSNGLLGDG